MLERFFDMVDNGQDVAAAEQLFADDAVFTFANSEPVHGRTAIMAGLDGSADAFKSRKHHVLNMWVQGDTIICQGNVSFTFHDDRSFTLPFCIIASGENGLFKSYQSYVDVSPLFAPAEETTNA